MNKITPTMIDDELVDKICEHIGYHTGCVQIVYQVLAWLANNPLTPTDVQADQLWHHPKVLSGDEHYAKAMARDWQRIAYLKKEEEIPQEVKSLLWVHNPFPNRGAEHRHNEAVLAAYKLGLSRK